MAVLIPCLDQLFDDFDDLAPNRSHSSDGWIGDASHSSGSSDHNPDETGNTPYEDSDNVDEVHAIDVDKDLNSGDYTMEECVQDILSRCRSGEEDRLHYIIYNRRIWSESGGWKQESYSGSNPHDHHAHFSACYESDREADRSPWFGDLMGLSSDDKKFIDQTVAKYVGDVVGRWTREGNHVPDNDPNPNQTAASALYYGGADGANVRYVLLPDVQKKLDALAAKVDDLANKAGR